MEDHHLGLLLSECYVALVQGISNFKFPCYLMFFMDSVILNRLAKVRKCVNWLLEPYLFTAFISLLSDWKTWRWMLNTIFYCWMMRFFLIGFKSYCAKLVSFKRKQMTALTFSGKVGAVSCEWTNMYMFFVYMWERQRERERWGIIMEIMWLYIYIDR